MKLSDIKALETIINNFFPNNTSKMADMYTVVFLLQPKVMPRFTKHISSVLTSSD